MTLLHDLLRIFDAKPATQLQAALKGAFINLYASTLEDGLRARIWREPELAAVEEQLRDIDLLAIVAASIRAERAFACHVLEHLSADDFQKIQETRAVMFNPLPAPRAGSLAAFIHDAIDKMRKRLAGSRAQKWAEARKRDLMPSGWPLQNMALEARRCQSDLEMLGPPGACFPKRAADVASSEEQIWENSSPYNSLAVAYLGRFSRLAMNAAVDQTLVNQDRVVCALERYRLAKGEYPEALEALVPEFIDRLPVDLIGGRDLKYRRKSANDFLLYSIGWNEKDDGGVAGNRFKFTDKDWVWGSDSQ